MKTFQPLRLLSRQLRLSPSCSSSLCSSNAPSLRRPPFALILQAPALPFQSRQNSTTSNPPVDPPKLNYFASQPSNNESSPKPSKPEPFMSFIAGTNTRPEYQITFTCKPCKHRSSHSMSKHGFHNGTVLITCPQCKNRHVISDHLKIFADLSFTVEDLMRDKGELVKRGSITEKGDVEFWTDESEQRPKTVQDSRRLLPKNYMRDDLSLD